MNIAAAGSGDRRRGWPAAAQEAAASFPCLLARTGTRGTQRRDRPRHRWQGTSPLHLICGPGGNGGQATLGDVRRAFPLVRAVGDLFSLRARLRFKPYRTLAM